MPKHDHDKKKHDHDKHKHDHEKHKHDHDKHKHDHDKHKHSSSSSSSSSSSASRASKPDVEKVDAAMGSATISTPVATTAASIPAAIKIESTPVATTTQPTSTAAVTESTSVKKEKVPIKTTRFWGGEDGTAFDDGIQKRILQISVSGGAVVDSITMVYHGGQKVKHGGKGGDEETLVLGGNEYINKVDVRANNSCVQQLTFYTNKGKQLGPVGGKGFGIGNMRKGEDHTFTAPSSKYMLKGIKGRKGRFIDAIAFYWGKVVVDED